MPKQLIYTSSKRGLEFGRSGYCTVARSEGMRKGLSSELESISSYDFSKSSAGPIYSYRVLYIQGIDYCVCSRISNCGFDYTGRTNFIAHHVVFEQSELSKYQNPAYFMLNWQGWRDSWNEPPRELTDGDFAGLKKAEIPKRWSDFSGSENAAFLEGDVKCVFRAVACGDFLELLSESLDCCKTNSWRYPFTTRLQNGESPGQYSIILDTNSNLGLDNRLVVDPRSFKIASVGKSLDSANEIETRRSKKAGGESERVRFANRRRHMPVRSKYPKSLLYPIYASLAMLALFSFMVLNKRLSGESEVEEEARFIPTVSSTTESGRIIKNLQANKSSLPVPNSEVAGASATEVSEKSDIANPYDNIERKGFEANTEAVANKGESDSTSLTLADSDPAEVPPSDDIVQAPDGGKKQPLEAIQFESIQKLFGLKEDFKPASRIFIIIYDKEGRNLTEKAFYISLREHSKTLKLLKYPKNARLVPAENPKKLIMDEGLIFDWTSDSSTRVNYFKNREPIGILFELEGETSAAIMLSVDSGVRCAASIGEVLSDSEEVLSLRSEFIKLFEDGQIVLPSAYTFGINIVFDDKSLNKIFEKFKSGDRRSYSKSDVQKFIDSIVSEFEKYKGLCASLEKLEKDLKEEFPELKGGDAKNIADYVLLKKEHLRDILNNPPRLDDNGEIEMRSLNNKIDAFVSDLKNKLKSIDKKKEKVSEADFKDFQKLVEEQSGKLGEATGFMENTLKSIGEDIGDVLGVLSLCVQIDSGKVDIKNAGLELAKKLEVHEENLEEAMESLSRPFEEILKSGNVELIFYKK